MHGGRLPYLVREIQADFVLHRRRDVHQPPFCKDAGLCEEPQARQIFVLSAKYGLLDLDMVIEPYELTLNKMPSSSRAAWAQGVLTGLKRRIDLDRDQIVFLAGLRYRELLVPHPALLRSNGRYVFWKAAQMAFGAKSCLIFAKRLHRGAGKLPRLRAGSGMTEVPSNGVYFLFEKGEHAHGGERVVRIGTHTGDNNLRKRLEEHFHTRNKDRSIFRKHIGRCLLRRDKHPYVDRWEYDLTRRADRARYEHLIDHDVQRPSKTKLPAT